MATSGGGYKHGIPYDPKAREKIRAGLNAPERQEFDEITAKSDRGGKPNKKQAQFIRRLIGQGKIRPPSKRFRGGSDRRTHQDS
jgi:hypothetical protein